MDKDRTSDRDDVEEYDEGWTGEVSRAGEDDRNDLASARTAMAEDRTILANERTYAGWMRTGMASVGIGLAFNALFVRMEPWWVPRSIATAFFLVAIFILGLGGASGLRGDQANARAPGPDGRQQSASDHQPDLLAGSRRAGRRHVVPAHRPLGAE